MTGIDVRMLVEMCEGVPECGQADDDGKSEGVHTGPANVLVLRKSYVARADAMVLFMWQDDIVSVMRFIDACLGRMLHTSEQP